MLEAWHLRLRQARSAWEARQRARLRLPALARDRGASTPPAGLGSAGTAPAVYFLTPDQDSPSGGVRVIYRHVDHLNAGGIAAQVLHQARGFRCTWFRHQTRVTDVRSIRLKPTDLLVLTEPDGDLLVALAPGTRHAVFNQSGHLTWKREAEAVTRHCLQRHDLLGMVTVSAHSTALLRHAFGRVPIHRVHLGIDPSLFHPGPPGWRPRRIGYMPRRGAPDASLVLNLLRARGALDGWELVPLAGLSHEAVADQLRTLRVFLSFPYQEGFGLPAAEAMACGTYTIGFHGYGGREYLLPEHSAPIEPGDVLGFATAVETALAQESLDDGWCLHHGRLASQAILAAYTPALEGQEVCTVYANLLGRTLPCALEPGASG